MYVLHTVSTMPWSRTYGGHSLVDEPYGGPMPNSCVAKQCG